MDTYKVGTTTNSTSTMHKLASTPITLDRFEIDNEEVAASIWEELIPHLEDLRNLFLDTREEKYWRALIELLPSSWCQTRTWTANYAVLRNIIKWRQNHRLKEWHAFCNWCHSLPYAEELLFIY